MSTTYKVRPANAQHKGQRESQQDAFGFSQLNDLEFAKHAGTLAVLADGMGGLKQGFWSSSNAVRIFIDAYANKTRSESVQDALQRAMKMANAVVYQEAQRLSLVENMGTTLVAAVVIGEELHWIQSGDSRVYLLDGGKISCLTQDHNYFNQHLTPLIAAGQISLSEANSNPKRDLLTSNLGRPEPITLGYSKTPLKVSDGALVLLCSDGLTDALSDSEIEKILSLQNDVQKGCDKLIDAVMAKSIRLQDNTTVIALQVLSGSKNLRPEGSINPKGKTKNRKNSFMNRTVYPFAISVGGMFLAVLLGIYGSSVSNDSKQRNVSMETIPIAIQAHSHEVTQETTGAPNPPEVGKLMVPTYSQSQKLTQLPNRGDKSKDDTTKKSEPKKVSNSELNTRKANSENSKRSGMIQAQADKESVSNQSNENVENKNEHEDSVKTQSGQAEREIGERKKGERKNGESKKGDKDKAKSSRSMGLLDPSQVEAVSDKTHLEKS